MMRAELEPLGFEVRWVDMRETGRAGHIVATHRGNGRGKRMLLIGHLDTVFEPDSPFQRFAREGNRATGPGVGDDKGGLVVIVAALRAMQAAGTLRDADITIVLTGDEERPGSPIAVARRDLIEAGRRADVALEFENLAREDGRDYRHHRPAQLDQLDAAHERPHRPFERRLQRRVSAMARSTRWRGSSTPSGASCPSPTSPTMSA